VSNGSINKNIEGEMERYKVKLVGLKHGINYDEMFALSAILETI
jgi:hypothetical protein